MKMFQISRTIINCSKQAHLPIRNECSALCYKKDFLDLHQGLPVNLNHGKKIILPFSLKNHANIYINSRKFSSFHIKSNRFKLPPPFTTGCIVGIALVVGSVNFYEYNQEKKLKQEKKELYDLLQLGNYSEKVIEELHSKKVENLSVEELYEQLKTYSLFGMGTHLNSLLDVPQDESDKPKESPWHDFKKLERTIDCVDAGLPYGNHEEIQRCLVLKQKLSNAIDEHEKQKAE